MGRPKNFSREEVLEKAIPLFWERGFADTSLQDLEKATGVNKSGLYSEFESKEELFLESLKHYLTQRDGGVLRKEPLGWDNIRNFMKVVCANGTSTGCLAVYSMRELAIVPEEAHELVENSLDSLRRAVAKNIAAEQSVKSPKVDADAMAEIVMTFFTGLCMEQRLGKKKTVSLRKIDSLIEMLLSL